MKLLFITQKVDRNDDILGVYHAWIEAIAKHAQEISVICLYKGEVRLPDNVRVYSLGKEEGGSRLKYLKRFYKYVWNLRHQYDTVFVHMNPEYMILGGWLWKILGKCVVFWYAHYLATLRLRCAALFATIIVTSVPEAFPIPSRKVVAVGQGIDVQKFKNQKPKTKTSEPFKILFLGRISPVKNLETLIDATKILRDKMMPIQVTIVGAPTDRDQEYAHQMRKKVTKLNLQDIVLFQGRVANVETPAIYADHDLFINLTRTGSFDKSTLEAMASGLPAMVCNKAFLNIFPAEWHDALIFYENDASDLAKKIERVVSKSFSDRQIISKKSQFIVESSHGLGRLAERLAKIFNYCA